MKVDVKSLTMNNLEAAFAGESMAHIRYLYFAKLCRAAGDEASAKLFEETASQEIQHAFGHVELIYPSVEYGPVECLNTAIAGETYEYSEMYPNFRKDAIAEKNQTALKEYDQQIKESQEHAEQFRARLTIAAKRFEALAKVEERHANQYKKALEVTKQR